MMHLSTRRVWTLWLAMVGAGAGAGATLAGCGYTDLEMAVKQRQIDALVTQVNALKAGSNAACGIDGRPTTRSTTTPALSSR